MATKRSAILETIRNLRSKARDGASTEAEAMEAAAVITKLMVRHDVTPEELEASIRSGEQSIGQADFAMQRKRLHPTLRWAWAGIQALTETTGYRPYGTGGLRFIGLAEDIEMAVYLSEMIVIASDRAAAVYLKQNSASRDKRYLGASFRKGFGARINVRLKELAAERKRSRSATGTDLVVCKNGMIDDYKKQMGITIRRGKTTSSYIHGDAYDAGNNAGGNLNLSRPLGGSGNARAITWS